MSKLDFSICIFIVALWLVVFGLAFHIEALRKRIDVLEKKARR